MLGDSPEKSKNSLKKAMKRRNAKTVQFSAPTYYEASEVDYSTDEEEEQEDDVADHPDDGSEAESAALDHDNDNQDEITAVETVQPKSQNIVENRDADSTERSRTPLEGEKDVVDDHPAGDHSISKDGSVERLGELFV